MSRRNVSVWLLLITTLFNLTACGTPEIDLKGATIIPSESLQNTASAFLFIINDGTGNDQLTGCALKGYSSVRGQLHNFVKGKMVTVGKIVVPAGETIHLQPGSLHLMFFGLPEEISEEITLILTFAESGPKEVRAQLAPRIR